MQKKDLKKVTKGDKFRMSKRAKLNVDRSTIVRLSAAAFDGVGECKDCNLITNRVILRVTSRSFGPITQTYDYRDVVRLP